jgi:hypothetical protein
MYKDIADRYGKKIGVHTHNNQQLAFANTIEAMRTGASYLDATVSGMGRGAGNCHMESMLSLLRNPKYRITPIMDFIAEEMPQIKESGATWGFDALLDLQYAHYWAKGEDKIRLGLLTGVSVGYMQNSKTLKDVTEQYTKHSEGDINYTIHMDEVTALNRQIQLEVPVMFSMITAKGFFLNAGPKFILPVHASFNQTLKNGDITANLVDMGVNVTENVVTGEIKEAKFVHAGVNDQQMDLTIAVGGELGYEHQLQSGHSVSVGLYANYGVFSTYKHNPTAEHIVDILPPTAEGVFQLTPNSMTNAYVNKLGYLDLGLKVAFHLNWKK